MGVSGYGGMGVWGYGGMGVQGIRVSGTETHTHTHRFPAIAWWDTGT
jgi:hypothetical protein